MTHKLTSLLLLSFLVSTVQAGPDCAQGSVTGQESFAITSSLNDELAKVLKASQLDVDMKPLHDKQELLAAGADEAGASDKKGSFNLNISNKEGRKFDRVGYDEAKFSNSEVNDIKNQYEDLKNEKISDVYNFLKLQSSSELQFNQKFDAYLREKMVYSTAQERKEVLQASGKLLSFERQLEFIAKLGGNALSNYDYERQAQGLKANTAVGCNEILSNLDNRSPLGVCRDISMCQAQILQDMGNKDNVYMVAYATPGNYHVSLVASDPSNPNIVHKISYDDKTVESRLRGVSALAQETNLVDVGITYRIFTPEGKMISSLPNEMGLVLNEATGGNNSKDFDPFMQEQYNVLSVGGGKGGVQGKVFVGSLSNGDEIQGISLYKDWESDLTTSKQGKGTGGLKQKGRIGGAVSQRHIELKNLNESNPNRQRQYDINQVYLVASEELAYRQEIGDHVTIEPFVQGRVAMTGVQSTQTPISNRDPKYTGDGDITVDYGVRGEVILNNEKTKINGEIKRQQTLGITDISKLSGSELNAPVNHDAVAVGAEHQVSEDIALTGGATYVRREYGSSAGAELGVKISDRKNKAETVIVGGFYTPTGKQAQGWQPGGADAGYSAKIMRKVGLDASGSSSADAGITFFKGQSGRWYVGSELNVRWN